MQKKLPEAKGLHLQNTENYHELIHDGKSATPTTTRVIRGRVTLLLFKVLVDVIGAA